MQQYTIRDLHTIYLLLSSYLNQLLHTFSSTVHANVLNYDTVISMMCTNIKYAGHPYTQYQYTVQLLQIVDAFARCVGGLLSVIGANLSLRINTTNGTTISEVHSVHWNSDNKT